MTLKEAVENYYRTEQRFRRPSCPHNPDGWVYVYDGDFIFYDGSKAVICAEDITATDWEAEGKKVTITREEFAAIWNKWSENSNCFHVASAAVAFKQFCSLLGFDE